MVGTLELVNGRAGSLAREINCDGEMRVICSRVLAETLTFSLIIARSPRLNNHPRSFIPNHNHRIKVGNRSR